MSLKMLKLITIEDDDENSEEDAINENEFLAGRKWSKRHLLADDADVVNFTAFF